jgi:sugar O-acyltransferase (sialic acid O-acetyltransferase NeuD family)
MDTNKQSLFVWGGANQAKILVSWFQVKNPKKKILIYDPISPSNLKGEHVQVLDSVVELAKSISDLSDFTVAIGGVHGFARFSTSFELQKLGLRPIDFIHETAFVHASSTIGSGAQIMPNATINCFVSIGEQAIINTSSTIDHEVVIGNGVHVMGCAAIAGCVNVKDFATIGTNATILPYLTIAPHSIVGAGAVVTKDTEPYGIYAGVPAKKIGENQPKFKSDEIDILKSLKF